MRGQQLVGVELVRMKKLAQPDGKVERVPFEGTESVLQVEQVIPAVGEQVDPLGLESLLGGRGFLAVDAWGKVLGHAGIFAGGDVRQGAGMVSIAIGDGRRAALAIAAYLKGQELETEMLEPIAYDQLNVNYYEQAPRVEPPRLPVAERLKFEEVEGGIDSVQAAAEAARCFSCGSCLNCDNCWTLCPDAAVLKLPDELKGEVRYVFDYTYCKGCGLCARECPCGFIVMEEEP
jgi:Pyruvate/2-oxoacid:ferredoxin oxidoreductase delta subunit